MLALASPLLQAGFEVKLVDNLTSPYYENVILREIEDAPCLGISLVFTGPMIGFRSSNCEKVKKVRPELPIILGGWHPSLVPDQTSQPISSRDRSRPRENSPHCSNSRERISDRPEGTGMV